MQLTLFKALLQQFEATGTLDKVRALLKREMFTALSEQQVDLPTQKIDKHTKVLNELIMEYLTFHGYENTLSVFRNEASYNPQDVPDLSSKLRKQLGIKRKDDKLM
jgi:hypothetical protein